MSWPARRGSDRRTRRCLSWSVLGTEGRMPRPTILQQIQALDPEQDHQRIVFFSTCCEFPFGTTRALELALFRTFCAPSISVLLDHTGEFRGRAQKRYDDTDLIVS